MGMVRRNWIRFWSLCLALTAQCSWAAEVQVAVAANFSSTMQAIAQAFEQESGHQVRIIAGATGKFYAQIKNGAPFQVLLAADAQTPLLLEQEGLAVAGTRFTYALGRLVLWSRQPNLVDAQAEVLGSARFKRLAIADPRLAPYGAAAMQTLEQLGVLAQVKDRLVQGESVTQVYQFAASANAELGFIASSQLIVDGKRITGSSWLVPESLHSPLRQDAILLKSGQANPAALSLMLFLRSPRARTLMRDYGYSH
jgi:molybdate transport system substrate-binding protein